MVARSGAPSSRVWLPAALCIAFAAAAATASEPGRFAPVRDSRPIGIPADDLPPTAISASFLELVDAASQAPQAPSAVESPPRDGSARPIPAARVPEQVASPPAAASRLAAPRLPEPLPLPTGEKPPLAGAAPPEAPATSPLLPDLALDDRDEPLTLTEVLQSVMLHYPLLQAVERERGIASGRLTTSMGAFDTNLAMSGNALSPGTYENYRSDVGLTQQFMTGGISAFGGFRTGFGDFPTYNLAQKTADAGEWRGGLNLPFAKNRDIDRARATRAQAQLDVAMAEPVIERGRLDFMRSAARAYWAWQGSGERYGAGEQLLELAVRRDGELAQKVARGATANIERVDNQQNIALRNGLVVQADRAVQQSSIELSLYHRDPSGRPLLARRSRMRPVPEPEAPTVLLYQESLARALGSRPEFQRLSLQREKLLVERRLAANQVLPTLDGQIAGNQDAGFGKSPLSGPSGLDRQVLQASLVFQLPAQRRDARGRLQTVESQLMQIDRQLDFAEDQVRAEVQDAFSVLERAYEFHKQAKNRLDLARLVAGAEREQLRLGRSDVLRVTLREQAAFDAQVFEITARQEFWRAESDLRAADTSLGPESGGTLRGMSLEAQPPLE